MNTETAPKDTMRRPTLPGMGEAEASACRYEGVARPTTDSRKAGPGILPLEDGKLLAERKVLDQKVGAAGEDRRKSPDDGKEAVERPRPMTPVGTEGNGARPRAIRVSCIG